MENITTNWSTTDTSNTDSSTTDTYTLFVNSTEVFSVNNTTSSLPSTTVPTLKHEELMWTLPTIIGVVSFLLAVAFIVFVVIKNCEICFMRIIFRYCTCSGCGSSTESEDKTRLHYSELQKKHGRAEEVDSLNVKGERTMYFISHQSPLLL